MKEIAMSGKDQIAIGERRKKIAVEARK